MKDFDYLKINSVSPLYLVANNVDGYIKESKRNKYSTLVSTDKNKKVLTKYTEIWDEIKNMIEKINNKQAAYEKYFIKIKFSPDNNLSLKTIKAP